MQFGKVLSKLIAKNGITQAELSRLSGVSRKTIGNFVTGVAKQPTLSHAKALADALGVSLDELAEMCHAGGRPARVPLASPATSRACLAGG